MPLNGSAYIKPVQSRHLEVKDRHIRFPFNRGSQCLCAIDRRVNVVAMGGEQRLRGVGAVGEVVGNQDT